MGKSRNKEKNFKYILIGNSRFSGLKEIFTDHLILLSNQVEILNDSQCLSYLGVQLGNL